MRKRSFERPFLFRADMPFQMLGCFPDRRLTRRIESQGNHARRGGVVVIPIHRGFDLDHERAVLLPENRARPIAAGHMPEVALVTVEPDADAACDEVGFRKPSPKETTLYVTHV